MNIQGSSSRFDFRKIEPRKVAAKPEPAVQKQNEPQSLSSLLGKASNSKLPAVLTGVKSDISASREAVASDETTEADAEESVSESAEELDEAGDSSNDYEPVGEREDPDEPNDQTEEQRQRKGKRLDTLETQYRSLFLLLDRLVDRLTATHDFLIQ